MCCAGCPGSPASAGPSGHSLRGMATLGLPALPPLTGTSVVTQVRLDPLLALMLYFPGLYRLTLAHTWLHELVHVHFLATGCLFFWPLIGLDPLPGRWPYPGRALLMLLSTPFHAVLGLTIMQSRELIAGDWYPSLHLSWADPYAD